MGKHDWIRGKGISVCLECGLVLTRKTSAMSCPPWSSTGEGETKTNRVFEAGEVEELKIIAGIIKERVLDYWQQYDVHSSDEYHLKVAVRRLEELIQKHEGHEQS